MTKEKLRPIRAGSIVLFFVAMTFFNINSANCSDLSIDTSEVCREFEKDSDKASFSCLVSMVRSLRNAADYTVKLSGPGSWPDYEFVRHSMIGVLMDDVQRVLIQVMAVDGYEPSDVEREEIGVAISEALHSLSVMYDEDVDNAPIESLFFLGVYTDIQGKPLSKFGELFRKPKILAAANLTIIRNKIIKSKYNKEKADIIDAIYDIKIEMINAFSYCASGAFFRPGEIKHLDLEKYIIRSKKYEEEEYEVNFLINKIAPNFNRFCDLNLRVQKR